MTRHAADAMRKRLIPETGTAVVVLDARTTSPTTVTCYGCWIKQEQGGLGLAPFGNVNVEQDKTTIMIPDSQLNPASNGRNIRAGDTITFEGGSYRVTSMGGGQKTVRTVWSCDVQQEFN